MTESQKKKNELRHISPLKGLICVKAVPRIHFILQHNHFLAAKKKI